MNDVQRYLVEEFVEDFRQQGLSRRELSRRAVLIMGGVAGAAAAIRQAEQALAAGAPPAIQVGSRPGALSGGPLEGIGSQTTPPPAQTSAFVVAPDDPAIVAEMITFPGEVGPVRGHLARPRPAGRYPAVVVVHENRGLVEPNMDIARRFAKEGFVALAPDFLSRVGGTEQFAADPAQATGAIGQLGSDGPAADGIAGAAYLLAQPFVSGKAGAIGYCYGGGVVWKMGVRGPGLSAIAPYYGSNPPLEEVANLRAAALGIYAENDTRITGASNELGTKLNETGATWEFWVAPGANHGFFNNTGNYSPDAAREAWARTLRWFERFLR